MPRNQGATKTKLESHKVQSVLVMPLRSVPGYVISPGRISMVTAPPLANVISPAWTAAVQTDESAV